MLMRKTRKFNMVLNKIKLNLNFRWWQVPYYWFGIKMYDLVAGDRNLKSSYYLSKKNTLELFPMLKSDNLCGGIVYYDGMCSWLMLYIFYYIYFNFVITNTEWKCRRYFYANSV